MLNKVEGIVAEEKVANTNREEEERMLKSKELVMAFAGRWNRLLNVNKRAVLKELEEGNHSEAFVRSVLKLIKSQEENLVHATVENKEEEKTMVNNTPWLDALRGQAQLKEEIVEAVEEAKEEEMEKMNKKAEGKKAMELRETVVELAEAWNELTPFGKRTLMEALKDETLSDAFVTVIFKLIAKKEAGVVVEVDEDGFEDEEYVAAPAKKVRKKGAFKAAVKDRVESARFFMARRRVARANKKLKKAKKG